MLVDFTDQLSAYMNISQPQDYVLRIWETRVKKNIFFPLT